MGTALQIRDRVRVIGSSPPLQHDNPGDHGLGRRDTK
jgi:hypothetical protein